MDISVMYNPTTPTELCFIMQRHGSDKGHGQNRGWHNYTTLYYPLFSPVRAAPLRVFELGLGTNNTDVPSNMGPSGKPGASLRGWREFFPRAQVYGADIDKRILFTEDRIHTAYCDQTDPAAIQNMWSSMPVEFDIIIEDGLHTFAANKCFFEHSYQRIAKGGIYVIEDIQNKEIAMFTNQINIWKQQYGDAFAYRLVKIPHAQNSHDNTVLLIQRIR